MIKTGYIVYLLNLKKLNAEKKVFVQSKRRGYHELDPTTAIPRIRIISSKPKI